MGGGRRMYGLSPTSVVRFEKSGDDSVVSFMSLVWLSDTCCVVVASCEFVIPVLLLAGFVPRLLATRARQSVFQNPFPMIPRTIHCGTL